MLFYKLCTIFSYIIEATFKMFDPKLYVFCKKKKKKRTNSIHQYLKFTSYTAQFSAYYTVCTLQKLML